MVWGSLSPNLVVIGAVVAEILDGEGGYTVYGKLMPASKSLGMGGLPLGLAHDMKLVRDVAAGQSLTWDDVQIDPSLTAYRLRKEMEALYVDVGRR